VAFSPAAHNPIGRADGSSGMNGPGAIIGTKASPAPANLSYLNSYYGPIPTCPPASPYGYAVDRGDDSLLNAPFNLLRDQTGRSRQYGYHVDIGAAEYIVQCSIQNAFVSNVRSTNAIIGV